MARDSRAFLWLYAVLFAFISVLFTGYRVYYHNQSLQIPLVHLLNDPTLYPGDPFAATLPYYASALWRVVAWLVQFTGLEPALLALFVVERAALMLSAAYLALTLAPKSRLAAVGAMTFFALQPSPILGGGTIVMPYFEQTGFAIPLLMLAMAEFVRARPLRWAVWMAVAFNCNSLYGAYALTYFAAAILASPEARSAWKRWAGSLVLFAALASPSIAMSASAYGKGAADNALWLTAAGLRIPHHIFPSTWLLMPFVKFNVVLFLAIILPWQLRKPLRLTLTWAAVSVAWVLLAFAAEMIGSPSLLILQPARATDFWYCFAAIAVIAALAERLNERSGRLALVVTLVVAAVAVRSFGLRLESDGPKAAMVWRPSPSKRQVARWALANTPKNATFLVNPNWGGFRALSKRPVFLTWKDGSALLWYRPFVSDWAERLNAIGYNVHRRKRPDTEISGQLDDLYDSITDARVRELRDRYRVRYWVVPLAHRSAFSTVFANRYYKILALPPPAHPGYNPSRFGVIDGSHEHTLPLRPHRPRAAIPAG